MQSKPKKETKSKDHNRKLYALLSPHLWAKFVNSTVEVHGDFVYLVDGSGPFLEKIKVAQIFPENFLCALSTSVEM